MEHPNWLCNQIYGAINYVILGKKHFQEILFKWRKNVDVIGFFNGMVEVDSLSQIDSLSSTIMNWQNHELTTHISQNFKLRLVFFLEIYFL